MTEKFDPAAPDKLAEKPEDAVERDKAQDDKLEKSLKDTFPASDPVSGIQATPDG